MSFQRENAFAPAGSISGNNGLVINSVGPASGSMGTTPESPESSGILDLVDSADTSLESCP